MMDDAVLAERWELFLEQDGAEIQKEIYDHLQDTAHLYDSRDGIHAKWSPDGTLGLLLVFHEEEAECLYAAFQAGLEGVEDAVEAFGVWTASLMGMIRQALVNWEE